MMSRLSYRVPMQHLSSEMYPAQKTTNKYIFQCNDKNCCILLDKECDKCVKSF